MPEYDICIIGSGPAGLTLCNELAQSGKRLCLIESGHRKLSQDKDNLKKLDNTGEIKIKAGSRERAWGGTSNTWSGLSAPLDSEDFDRWPISYGSSRSIIKGWLITDSRSLRNSRPNHSRQ
jgi:choline dehydrogenase-like flavoprotein